MKRHNNTLEGLASNLGVAASLVEVVAGTDCGETATDLEGSGHGVGSEVDCLVRCQFQWDLRVRMYSRWDFGRRGARRLDCRGVPCLAVPIASETNTRL